MSNILTMWMGETARAWASRLLLLSALCFLCAHGVAGQPVQGAQAGTLEEAQALNTQVIRLHREGRYAEAVPLAERSLAIRERLLGPDRPEIATALNNLARLYEEIGDYAKAEAAYLRAISVYGKALGPAHVSVAAPSNNLAELYMAVGEHAKAEPLFLRAISIVSQTLGPEHPNVATSTNSLAALYQEMGEYEKAEQSYRRALAIREKVFGPGHEAVAETLGSLGRFYRVKGDYERAEPLFERAQAIYERAYGPEHPRVAQNLNSHAILLVQKGDYVRAEPLHRRALSIREKVYGAEHAAVGESLNNLALLYDERGDYVKAEEFYRRSAAVAEKAFGPDSSSLATSLNNLAELYRKYGDYARAEPLYRRALEIYERVYGPEHPRLAVSLNNLGLMYRQSGDATKAEPLYRRALFVAEKAFGPEHPQVANTVVALGDLFKWKGEFVAADEFYRRALSIDEKVFGSNSPRVAETLGSFASMYEAKGDAARAVEFLERTQEVREYNLSLILSAGSERQKLLYLDTLTGETHAAVSLHLRAAPTNARALRLALTTVLRRKGRALDAMAEQVAGLRRRLDPQDRALLNRLTEAQSQLSTLVTGGAAPQGRQLSAEVARLEAEIERLQDAIGRRSPQFGASLQPVTLEEVRRALPPGAALVEFVAYRPFNARAKTRAEFFGAERYAVYILPQEGEPRWADLGAAKEVEAGVSRLRAALKDPESKDVKELARALDERVMLPVRKLLGDARQIFVSPDGALNLVPFAALVDEEGRYLVENYSMTYLTSGRDLLRLQTTGEGRQPPLVIADPHFGAADAPGAQSRGAGAAGARRSSDMEGAFFTRLPGTAEEASVLAVTLPGAKVLTQAQATEAALKQASAPRVLHVATHGFFLPDQPPPAAGDDTRGIVVSASAAQTARTRAENPLLRSGLALEGANRRQSGGEDGILTALEAAGLDLWGTQLVVLSACETGLGEVRNGDGVYGLRRALVLAGAESQVMSLWQVSDAATRDLMVAYYKRLTAGEGRTEALRRVQLAMLKGGAGGDASGQRGLGGGGAQTGKTDFSHPFYWASFIQSGDWRVMSGRAALVK